MTRDFDHVFSRIGVRGAEYGDQHFVDRPFTIADGTVTDGKTFRVGKSFTVYAMEDFVSNGYRIVSADADQGYGTASTGGESSDRVVF